MITQLKFVGIATSNQERALRFYTEKLGFAIFFNGSFACDDVQATYRQLMERGVEFVKRPKKQPRGEFAIFKGPDGNQFVLSSS